MFAPRRNHQSAKAADRTKVHEPALIGDRLGGEIHQDPPPRVPGPKARRRQREEYPLLVAASLRRRAKREGLVFDPEDVTREVQRATAAVAARRLDIEKAIEQVEPVSAARPASEVNRTLESAAVLRLPVLVWAWRWLMGAPSGSSEVPPWRPLAVAVGMHMGFSPVIPCASRVLERFCHMLSPEAWQHRYPGAPPSYRDPTTGKWDLSAFYKQLKLIFGPRNPVRMWMGVNRELVLELLGEHSVHEKRGGEFANVPDALKYLVVDAVLIEADLSQRMPVSAEHAELMRKGARARTGFVVYKSGGVISKKCHGYKWLQVSALKLGGVALHGRLAPANCNERAETIKLLDEMFELWPELQSQKDIILVGDSLYDQSEDFAYELAFRFGIHPCFPRSGKVDRKYMHSDTDGVPLCGKCGKLAVLAEADSFPTPFWRQTHGAAQAGHWMFNAHGDVIDSARLRWRCADHKPGCRAPDTYPRENPRLYTWLPHAGNHNRAALRTALLAYRNVIESSFAVLKDMGLAGKAQARPRWAGDDQMDHLCWMAATTMAARRVAHDSGLYQEVYDEAVTLGLMQAPTATNRQGPTNRSAAEALADEQAWLCAAKAPTGWPEADPGMAQLV